MKKGIFFLKTRTIFRRQIFFGKWQSLKNRQMSEKKINYWKKRHNCSNKIQNMLLKATLTFKVLHGDFTRAIISARQTPSDWVIGPWEFHTNFLISKFPNLLWYTAEAKKKRKSAQLFHRKWRNNNNKGGNLLINFSKLLIRPIWMYDYMVKRHAQPFYVYHLTGNVYRFSYWNRKLLDWIIWINYASSD